MWNRKGKLMFTIKHFNRVVKEIRGVHRQSPFCCKKNRLSYKLSKLNSQYRGMVAERLVRDIYKSQNKSVFYFGGSRSYDMLVNGYKVEVKSCLAVAKTVRGEIKYTYEFKHICPANFHKLVLVFISPEGVKMRVMSSKTASKYLGVKNRHKNLYVGQKILGKVLAA